MRVRTTPRELTGQLIVLVAVLWTVALVNTLTTGERLRSGQIKGTDFLHFYALATVASSDAAQFADEDSVRAAQLKAVPESTDHVYPPVYGPQVALALAPLARFPYTAALGIWVALSALLYFAAVLVVVRYAVAVRQHRNIVLLAAAGFPPFWYLLQHGQLSAVALAVVVVSWLALRRGQEAAAGALLGLLIYKPSLFAPIFGILLLSGSWRTAVAMLLTGVAEVVCTAAWVGVDGLVAYLQLTLRLPRMASLMAAKPDQMHSLRSLWALLLPGSMAATILYVGTAALVMIGAASVWRRLKDPGLRMSALLLGAVLASPHLYMYELVILAPVWIWLTDWFLSEQLPVTVGRVLYVGYFAALLGQFAQVIPVQVSVLCFVYLSFSLWLWARQVMDLGNSGVRLTRLPADPRLPSQTAQGWPTLSR